MDILAGSADLLKAAGFATRTAHANSRPTLLFESETVLGFIFAYGTLVELAGNWQKDATTAISEHQFGLRIAAQKAWNTYVILLVAGSAKPSETAMLAAIEEDLSGTRKIARADVSDSASLNEALLPLLPIQAAPHLTAVDVRAEIRERTTELPPRAVQAFLSMADAASVLQVLEETP